MFLIVGQINRKKIDFRFVMAAQVMIRDFALIECLPLLRQIGPIFAH